MMEKDLLYAHEHDVLAAIRYEIVSHVEKRLLMYRNISFTSHYL